MPFYIVYSPSGLGGVAVSCRKRRCNKWMSATYAGIKECDIPDVCIFRKRRAFPHFLDPVGLLGNVQTIKEIGGYRRSGERAI